MEGEAAINVEHTTEGGVRLLCQSQRRDDGCTGKDWSFRQISGYHQLLTLQSRRLFKGLAR